MKKIVPFFFRHHKIFLIGEYFEYGDLASQMLLQKTAEIPYPESLILSWLSQALSALDHAHKAGVVHRGLRPTRILLQKNVNIKLSDFALDELLKHTIDGKELA
jgi:serine/threonine protein kinase